METQTRPLISFVMLAFNQEQYIREAILGAFSQTYTPLEIILSDDCSTDQTYEIMREMADSYAGPHSIVLNRSPRNLGLAAHINFVMSLTKGQFIVSAAGDDIAYPERAQWTFDEWRKEPAARSIYFNVDVMSEDGATQFKFEPRPDLHSAEAMVPMGGPRIVGAAHSWHRELFDAFGPLPETNLSEDKALPFRAALCGRLVFVDKPAIRYRVHSGSMSTSSSYARSATLEQYRELTLRGTRRRLCALDSFSRDVAEARRRAMLSAERARRLEALISRTHKEQFLMLRMRSGDYMDRLMASTLVLFKRVESWQVPMSLKLKHWLHVAIPPLERRRFRRGKRKFQGLSGRDGRIA